MTEQDQIIGRHPDATHILGEWLIHSDQPASTSKKHRNLDEIESVRTKAIENIADWIVEHHIIEDRITALKRKAEILQKYEFDEFVESQHLLPTAENTMRGNVAEIILIEYLKKKYKLFTNCI